MCKDLSVSELLARYDQIRSFPIMGSLGKSWLSDMVGEHLDLDPSGVGGADAFDFFPVGVYNSIFLRIPSLCDGMDYIGFCHFFSGRDVAYFEQTFPNILRQYLGSYWHYYYFSHGDVNIFFDSLHNYLNPSFGGDCPF